MTISSFSFSFSITISFCLHLLSSPFSSFLFPSFYSLFHDRVGHGHPETLRLIIAVLADVMEAFPQQGNPSPYLFHSIPSHPILHLPLSCPVLSCPVLSVCLFSRYVLQFHVLTPCILTSLVNSQSCNLFQS